MTIEPNTHLVWQLRVTRILKAFPPEGLDAKAFAKLVGTVLETKDKDMIMNAMAACDEVLVCGKDKVWRIRQCDATQAVNQASARS